MSCVAKELTYPDTPGTQKNKDSQITAQQLIIHAVELNLTGVRWLYVTENQYF